MTKNFNPIFGFLLAVAGIVAVVTSCSKDTTTDPITYGSVSDFEGNAYKTVQIGSQTWMAENLKSIKLSDGTAIELVKDNSTWANLTTPAYCTYGNDSVTAKDRFGLLYNWYTVNTKKLCPTGWHVPTNNDWIALATFLGTDSLAGGKLKEASTYNWFSPNLYATNVYGFKAIPCGYRYYNGSFQNFGYSGNWWSATEFSSKLGWYRFLSYNDGKIGAYYYDKVYGFSVRCVKD